MGTNRQESEQTDVTNRRGDMKSRIKGKIERAKDLAINPLPPKPRERQSARRLPVLLMFIGGAWRWLTLTSIREAIRCMR